MNSKLACALVVGVAFGFNASFVARQPAEGQVVVKGMSWEYRLVHSPGGKYDAA
jgi:hypothetical protein